MRKPVIVLILSLLTGFNYSCKKKDTIQPAAQTTQPVNKSTPPVNKSTPPVVKKDPSTGATLPAGHDPQTTPAPQPKPTTAVNVAYTIKSTEATVDASKLNLAPGSIVALEPGTRGPLYLMNFEGTAGQPITIINSGGQTVIQGNGPWALKVGFSKHFRITGSGDGGGDYGIVVEGGNNSFVLPEFCTDYELDHVEVRNSGFAGIMAKTDPSCDSKTWRDNFVMRNVSFHHNYVHDTQGEAFYIGNSFYNGKSESCGTVYPHTIEGIRVYKNVVHNSGCEGIQVGCAIKDCEIYDNVVEDFGKSPFSAHQNNGIQIGAGTCGKCYNNIIKDGPGNGLIMNGVGGNLFYNNLIINPGELGIFCDERTETVGDYSFINNTIINPGTDGIKLYAKDVGNNVINNIIVNPGSGKYINSNPGVRVNDKNNYFTKDINAVKFSNPSSGNYSLLQGSPAIDEGENVGSFGINNDLSGNSRPSAGQYDAGAYEYTGAPLP